MLELLLSSVLVASTPKEYVEGYGLVTQRSIAACLYQVGAHDVDELSDSRWESFTDCLTYFNN